MTDKIHANLSEGQTFPECKCGQLRADLNEARAEIGRSYGCNANLRVLYDKANADLTKANATIEGLTGWIKTMMEQWDSMDEEEDVPESLNITPHWDAGRALLKGSNDGNKR